MTGRLASTTGSGLWHLASNLRDVGEHCSAIKGILTKLKGDRQASQSFPALPGSAMHADNTSPSLVNASRIFPELCEKLLPCGCTGGAEQASAETCGFP